MRIKFAYIFLIINILTLNAQDKVGDITINYGDEITEEKGKIIYIIGEANNRIYALGLKGKNKYFLTCF